MACPVKFYGYFHSVVERLALSLTVFVPLGNIVFDVPADSTVFIVRTNHIIVKSGLPLECFMAVLITPSFDR